MNRETLCDDLQKLNDEKVQSFFIQDAITMLRQQQAEIEALKAKTLTDEEILEIANKFKNLEWAIVAFARAILRKAQEK